MSEFHHLFERFYRSVNDSSLTKSAETLSTAQESKSFADLPAGPQDEYLIQKQLRPCFGKEGVNDAPIGTHPDFLDLEGTDTGTQKHYICTLFVDIKGSTRLSLLYPLEVVYLFKNTVIKSCIETVRSFDGYVHRIMGDAVMAFFGGKNSGKENAIADAINCQIALRALLEESIKPWMEKQGIESKDFGFRIGCDFGDDEEVLWGGFGYENVGEVSATGLPVDMASKLQGLAAKNQAMLGQGLLDYVYWPEHYSEIKQSRRNGSNENLHIVIPNLTDAEGKTINYKMRQLSYPKCLEFSALPSDFKSQISGSKVIHNPAIHYKCYTVEGDQSSLYRSASRFLEKRLSLKFEVFASTRHRLFFPLKAVFSKTNHGPDTPPDERNIEQEGEKKDIRKSSSGSYGKNTPPFAKAELEEATLYRGLHTMKCEVFDANESLIFRDWIGVMIK